ncbi:MAG: hypothetical protein ABSA33_05680 [Candidatus Micrarchaeaceae archaeon]
MAIVLQDQNGVAYLCLQENIRIPGTRQTGIKAVVNKGNSVQVVTIDSQTVERMYLQPVKCGVVEVANLLLHPTGNGVTVSNVAQRELAQCIKEEVEMAKKATAEVAAVVKTEKANKFTKVTAAEPAATHKGKVGEAQTMEDLKGNALYSTKVVTTGLGKEARAGSLWAVAHEQALKPITLGDLITNVTEKVVLKSEKDKETVVRIRLRDGFTRLGYLKAA